MEFKDVVRTEDELRKTLGHPTGRVARKVLPALDRHCRAFIARSPFLLIASSDSQGNVDLSPKGDPPGFVAVLDDTTLAIPDRPGNRRGDTFSNILQNPQVGLFFMVPGTRETLRISGRAEIVRDEPLRTRMAIHGKLPSLALVVRVEEAFFHCAKCVIRSNLWLAGADAAGEPAVSLAEAMIDAASLEESMADVQASIEESYAEGLY
jgi:PPOX class probable FMN-dependent enzyme